MDSAIGKCHCPLNYRKGRRQNIDLSYIITPTLEQFNIYSFCCTIRQEATECNQRINTVDKYSYCSLFAVSQISGFAPRIKIYHSTLNYGGASELLDNSNVFEPYRMTPKDSNCNRYSPSLDP
jgi:hypothetical protein